MKNTATAILERYVVADNGCWHYTGTVDAQGYGRARLGKRFVGAHRLAHVTWLGPIPTSFHVDHTCHNGSGCEGRGVECLHRRCINPWHLEAVTPQENISRSHLHSGARTHCLHGHPYDEANTRYQRSRRGVQRYCAQCVTERNARLAARRRAS